MNSEVSFSYFMPRIFPLSIDDHSNQCSNKMFGRLWLWRSGSLTSHCDVVATVGHHGSNTNFYDCSITLLLVSFSALLIHHVSLSESIAKYLKVGLKVISIPGCWKLLPFVFLNLFFTTVAKFNDNVPRISDITKFPAARFKFCQDLWLKWEIRVFLHTVIVSWFGYIS